MAYAPFLSLTYWSSLWSAKATLQYLLGTVKSAIVNPSSKSERKCPGPTCGSKIRVRSCYSSAILCFFLKNNYEKFSIENTQHFEELLLRLHLMCKLYIMESGRILYHGKSDAWILTRTWYSWPLLYSDPSPWLYQNIVISTSLSSSSLRC
jgi:hypothetical protein